MVRRHGKMVDARGPNVRNDWGTPPALFKRLDDEFHFTIDAAADESNHLCPVWFGPGGQHEDALTTMIGQEHTVWLNPPYSRIADFVTWAVRQRVRLVTLVPSRTDTRWWKQLTDQAEVRFLFGRLRFVGAPSSAPFPSAIIVLERIRPTYAGWYVWNWKQRG